MLEPAIKDLASNGKNFAMFGVHLPNGQIANHVMWVDADDEHVLINTEIHRDKFKAIEHDPNVTVTIWKADNPYAYAEVRGVVTDTVRGPEARQHIDELSERYMGHPYGSQIESERVIVKIRPDRQRSRNL
jgi:PPOX class probable F420-dependent enzyme